MNIQVMSDLHIEFQMDNGKSFVDSLDPTGIDVLVLAGDISVGTQIPQALSLICKRYENSKVIYVHGNHEFYGSDYQSVQKETYKAINENENLIWLENDRILVDDVFFFGTPLWFRDDPLNNMYEKYIGDFHHIKDLSKWVYEFCEAAIWNIRQLVDENTIVITHHLPTFKSVPAPFKDSPINRFFVCNVENEIIANKPKLWIHGHTHTSFYYKFGDTRIVCNPFGYLHALNSEFNDRLVIPV